MIKSAAVKAGATETPDRHKPRHRVLADALRKAIREGDYPVGGRLPTEEQLGALFGVSRQTLREALRALTHDGLITRRPRSGSVVVAKEPPTAFNQSFASIEGLLNYPPGTVRRTVRTKYIEADHDLARLLRCAPGAAFFVISAMRFSDASPLPICWTDIYLPPRFAGVLHHRRHEHITVADQIAELYGEVAVSTQVEIAAGEVSSQLARRLSVPAGSPALIVTRRYADAQGETLETTISVHPAQRYSCRFEFRRTQQNRPA